MAGLRMSSLRCVVILLIISLILLEIADCRRGGGGGSSRGGGRSSSSRSSRTSRTSRTSGTSRSSRYSVRQSYRGPRWSGGSWKTAAAAGVVFGLASYQTRRLYRSYPNREPAICFNEKNLKNGTYGYFVCPQRYQSDQMSRCCGSSDEEYCCKGLSGGAIAGIVVGIIVFIIVIIGIVVFCKYKSKRRAKSGEVISKQPKAEQQPLNPGTVYKPSNPNNPVTWNKSNDDSLPYNPNPAGYGYPPAATGLNPDQYPPQQYGVQQTGPGPIGFESTDKGPLPEGDMSGGLPYPSNPSMAYPPPGHPTVAPPPYPST